MKMSIAVIISYIYIYMPGVFNIKINDGIN